MHKDEDVTQGWVGPPTHLLVAFLEEEKRAAQTPIQVESVYSISCAYGSPPYVLLCYTVCRAAIKSVIPLPDDCHPHHELHLHQIKKQVEESSEDHHLGVAQMRRVVEEV